MMRKKGKGTVYRIVVRSELTDRYACAFEGMELETKNGQTILTGEAYSPECVEGVFSEVPLGGLPGVEH